MQVNQCNYQQLGLDEACTLFRNANKNSNFSVYSLISDCILCPFTKISRFIGLQNTSLIFNSAETHHWRIFEGNQLELYKLPNDTRDLICELSPKLGQYGIYEVTIENNTCGISTVNEPSNSYTPLVIIFGILLCILILVSLGSKYMQSRKLRVSNNEEQIETTVTTKKRVLSIDTFRGASILAMIFVNNGAGNYLILEHATWNGLYIGDLVFPSFIWIMGFCIPIALTSQLSRGISRFKICQNIVKRSILLFFIGICLNTIGTNSQLEKIRIFGVLQRFGVCYLIVGIIYVLASSRQPKSFQHGWLAKISDLVSLMPQWIVISTILTIHCVITFRLNIPGCPKGYLGPGGRHEYGINFNCTGGAAGYIDKVILGTDHLYQHAKIRDIYGSEVFDPEGILGCLTTMFQTFIGVHAGKILRVHKNSTDRIIRWMIMAIIYGCLGSILNFTELIPINKNLWSISFVLVTSGLALVVFTVFYILVDVTHMWIGGPFRIPGMNALIMYIGHQMCYQIFPFHWRYGDMNTHAWKTISCLWDVTLWTIIAYILHRKRIYINL